MFQSIWTIFRELTLVLAKVTLFEILPLKCSVKRFSVPWFRLSHSTQHWIHPQPENLLTLHFNGKI
jgi:hypothetical protein